MDIIPGNSNSKRCKRGWLHGEGPNKRGCVSEGTVQTHFAIYTPVAERCLAWHGMAMVAAKIIQSETIIDYAILLLQQ